MHHNQRPEPLQQQVDLLLTRSDAVASLAGPFRIVAMRLAAVGMYGVTAYIQSPSARRRSDPHGPWALDRRQSWCRWFLPGRLTRVGIGGLLLLGVTLATVRSSYLRPRLTAFPVGEQMASSA